MSHYKHSLTIKAPAGRVFDALTTPGGLSGWWTADCDVAMAEGDKSRFRFVDNESVMLIRTLETYREVAWECVVRHHFAPGNWATTDEWKGTVIRFELNQLADEQTRLDFEHVGLTPKLNCWETCRRDWNLFLDQSLKPFCESGNGKPYRP